MREGAGAGLGKISWMDDGTDIPHGVSPIARSQIGIIELGSRATSTTSFHTFV
jgi:hypothetical protein